MKTKQEQIEEMSCILTMLINCGGGCMAQYCHLVDNYAKKLIEAGYGDVSEYKAEREMLGSQIKVLKQRLNNKYVEIEKLKAETSNIRKETAREILDMLYDIGIDKEILECCRIFDVNGVSLAKQICEKYGVEIEK